MVSPFSPSFEHLPKAIPIFPLTGAVVLPHTKLPLNIFEPRYVNMVNDALSSHRLIGMIQPTKSKILKRDVLHKVGCAGRITAFEETGDGRIQIVLSGICRFEVIDEIPTTRGYRQMKVDWSKFKDDMSLESVGDDVNIKALMIAVAAYAKRFNIQGEWQQLQKLPGDVLTNFLAMNLPFESEDKQDFLEAMTLHERADMMVRKAQLNAIETAETKH